jgi:hypothetical protein
VQLQCSGSFDERRAIMILVRKYEVTIPDEHLEKIEAEGWPQGELLMCCALMSDIGDFDPAVLVKWTEGTLEWMPEYDVYDGPMKVLYTVPGWTIAEYPHTVE